MRQWNSRALSFHQGAVASPLSPSLYLGPHFLSPAWAARLCCFLRTPKGTASSLKLLSGTASNLFLWPALTTGHRAERHGWRWPLLQGLTPREGLSRGPRGGRSPQHLTARKGSTTRAPGPAGSQLPACFAVEPSGPKSVSAPHRQPGAPALDRDLLCPETLSPSQPTCDRATSPRTREEDDLQAPDGPEQDRVVDGMKAPADRVGAGAVPGPAASGQDLGGSADAIVDSPGTRVSRSPTCQCLPTSCGFADLSSGPDPALVGHKRKAQFPGGNAEKRPGVSWPQASFFVPRALSPCGTWTTDGRQLFSLPLSGQESSPLTSVLPLCPPQTSLSLPDPFPWQLTDRPAPWPGGGYSPGSEDSECAAPSPVSQQIDQPPSCSATAGRLAAHLHSAAGT